ncbi:Ig-like domain-containing protein [bacterium]|nr:Ig-like domain-containing protein [bacterium]
MPILELSKSELSLIVGSSEDITVSLEGKTVTEGLKYDVKDTKVAKVENGKVTALAKGSTTVTVSLEGANSAVFTVETVGEGDFIEFGRYRQTGEGDNVDEWEPQPIEWKILDIDTENNRVLLLSLYGLDAKAFDDKEPFENVWKDSEICKWLNGDFYNTAFDETEKGKIQSTKLSDVDDTGTYNVFLLSKDELRNTKYFADDESTNCLATAYAKKHDALVISNDNCLWWLRSPYPDTNDVVYSVRGDGYIRNQDVDSNSIVVRPALWINL